MPLAAAVAVLAAPAFAQRDVILAHDYNFATAELNKENEALAALDKQIGATTDLKTGCGLLDEKLTHLKKAEVLLGQMVDSAHQLKRRKEEENAAKLRKDSNASIELTQADITRLCASLPKTQ
jgi:isocitrate/isopropylmalate dehydrogenase